MKSFQTLRTFMSSILKAIFLQGILETEVKVHPLVSITLTRPSENKEVCLWFIAEMGVN